MFLSLHVLLVVVLFPRGLVGCMAAMSAKGESKGKGRGKGCGRELVYAERGIRAISKMSPKVTHINRI